MALAIPDMLTACDFMSLMVGAVISPASVRVTTTGDADRLGQPPVFSVYARWRDPGEEIDPQNGRQCVAAPLLDSPIYEGAIAAWLARREAWRTSYALGTVCLTHQGEISSRRFLDAAAWFESVPTGVYETQRDRIGKALITTAAAAASAAFEAGGAKVSVDRARELLSPVNASSLGMRIRDALALARAELGSDALPAALDALAAVIPRIRGKFAHGEDAFASNLGHLVHDATLMLEVLACIVTLEGLGGVQLTPDRHGHPLRRALLELQHFDANELPAR